MPLPDILDTGFKTDESKLWAIDIPVEEVKKAALQEDVDPDEILETNIVNQDSIKRKREIADLTDSI